MSRILREHYEKKRMRLPDWLFDENVPVSRRSSSSNRRDHDQRSPVHSQQQLAADGPMRTPSRRRLWEQNPQDAKNMSSRERERQELRQAQPPMPPSPSSGSENRSRYSNRDHYYSEDRDNSSSSGGRYSNHRDTYEDDRYSSNHRHYEDDYDRRSQPTTREDDRYYDDRYKSNRRDDYGQGRDRYDTPPPPQTRGSRDQPRYYDDDHHYQQHPSSQQRPLSPLQKQHSNSTNRSRYPEEDRGGYYDTAAPVKSERSTRGYGDRSNRYDQGPPAPAATAYDDYYDTRRVPSQSRDRAARYQDHGPPEMNRREPSIRSGGRRYGNDPSYF